MGVYELRAEIVEVVKEAALLPCACTPERPCLSCRAGAMLESVQAVIGLRRWRNTGIRPAVVVHTAGAIQLSREYRRSCPGYITDRWQCCQVCGTELLRGRWAMFFTPGSEVGELPPPGPHSAPYFFPHHETGATDIDCDVAAQRARDTAAR